MKRIEKNWVTLCIFIVFYLALFLFYYPPLAGIEDEIGFVNLARSWEAGKLYLTESEYKNLPLADYYFSDGRWLPQRNPGRALAVLPFFFLEMDKGIFLAGAIVHILLTYLVARFLTTNKISPLFALFALLHPTLALYSRTITGDALAGCFLLMSYLFYYHKKHPVLIGITVAAAAVVRYHGGLFLPLICFLQWRRGDSIKSIATTLFSGGAVAILLFIYNFYLYQSPIGITADKGAFSWTYLQHQLPFYIPALLILWPGMLLMPFFISKSRSHFELLSIVGVLTGFFCFYYYHDSRPNWLVTAIIGQRLLQIALPFWIIIYILGLNRIKNLPLGLLLDRFQFRLLILIGLILLGLNGAIFHNHQSHLKELENLKSQINRLAPQGSVLVGNASFQKIVGLHDFPGNDYKHTAIKWKNDKADFINYWAEKNRKFLGFYFKGAHETHGIIEDFSEKYRLIPLSTGSSKLVMFEVLKQ